MGKKLCDVLKETTQINNIKCRFDSFKENEKENTLECTIQFPSGSGLTVFMFKQYLKDFNLCPQIKILEDGNLTGANVFSLSNKQYAKLSIQNSPNDEKVDH